MQRIISKIFQITNLILLAILSSCTPTIKTQKGAKIQQTEVALLLPLTGEQANTGNRLERVIRKGFADIGDEAVNIKVYDVGNPETITKSINKAVSKRAKIIIGPLFSNDSRIVADKIKGTDITLISLSNDPSLAKEQIYVYGHAPKHQNKRLIEYFLGQGHNNFIILLPVGAYFQNLNRELQSFIVANNGTLVRSEFYPNDEEGIKTAVRNVSMAVDRLNEDEQNTKKPVVLVVEDPRNFDHLLETIDRSSIDKNAELASDWRINNAAASKLDYTFTGASQMADSEKLRTIQSVAGTYPSALDYIAYDLGNIVMKSLNQKYEKQQFINVLRNSAFSGLSGKVKFQGYIATRPYDIIKHSPQGYLLLEEAP
jgi:ABC-type branched-subunit amino acid transport system substrate-binding protein